MVEIGHIAHYLNKYSCICNGFYDSSTLGHLDNLILFQTNIINVKVTLVCLIRFHGLTADFFILLNAIVTYM